MTTISIIETIKLTLHYKRFYLFTTTGCEDLDRCRCNMTMDERVVESQNIVVEKGLSVQMNVPLNNLGSEPAFNFRMELSSPLSFLPPAGFTCKDTTGANTNREAVIIKCWV